MKYKVVVVDEIETYSSEKALEIAKEKYSEKKQIVTVIEPVFNEERNRDEYRVIKEQRGGLDEEGLFEG